MTHAQDWISIVGVFLVAWFLTWGLGFLLDQSDSRLARWLFRPRDVQQDEPRETPYLVSWQAIYPSHLPSVKTFDRSNFAESHGGTVVDIQTRSKR